MALSPDQTTTATALCLDRLDRLETLQLTLTDSYEMQITVISSSWSMPSLRQLRLDLYGFKNYTDHCTEFFRRYGGGLRYLHIYPSDCYTRPIDLPIPLQYCPALEHLVLRPGSHLQPPHPTVKWVDIRRTKHFDDKQKYIALRQTFT